MVGEGGWRHRRGAWVIFLVPLSLLIAGAFLLAQPPTCTGSSPSCDPNEPCPATISEACEPNLWGPGLLGIGMIALPVAIGVHRALGHRPMR